ncbi:MAG: sigma-70 family RNA polymerase sigma factor [Anaerolineales bacterium]|nr:sigma-70 family RNA polymerase sigma factor [Chloroflexota bacterium]MBL6980186.1 sigma-70 family RNA polymerase sigma factor [Anaerolineales bacterium]
MNSKNKLFAKDPETLHDSSAFHNFYQQTHLIVFRYIFGMYNGSVQDVEDMTADTYARAWKARRRFRGTPEAALGWLLRIARNLVIDTFRRRKNRGIPKNIDDHIIPSPSVSPEERVLQKERANNLWVALGKLSPQQREIIVLRYLLNWQVKAIASYLDMKENTISVNIRRALQKMRQEYKRSHEEVGHYEDR